MDEISQREKREVLRNDSYFSRQQNAIDEAGGRYAQITPSKLTGQGPSVPQQPESSHWAKGIDEVVGAEPSFGVDIDFVGDLGGASAPSAAVETTPLERGGLSSTPVDDPPQPTQRKRRRV